MMKFMGSLMIVIGCSYIGFIMASSLKNRRKELLQLQKAVHILESEIMYVYTEIPYIFVKIGESVGGYIGKIFNSAGNNLIEGESHDIYDSLEISIKECSTSTCLEKKDINIVLELGKVLGKWDIESHKKELELAKNNITENIQESKDKELKMSKMYEVLGISFGLTICILLI